MHAFMGYIAHNPLLKIKFMMQWRVPTLDYSGKKYSPHEYANEDTNV